MTNKYIKFRVVEQNGLFSIQGLRILCPKLEGTTWFFKGFWERNRYLNKYDVELEQRWDSLEWENGMVPGGCGYFIMKTYTSKKTAFSALDKFIRENMIEPTKQSETENEIKVVARD